MSNANVSSDKQQLVDWITVQCGELRSKAITKEKFLHDLWSSICATTQWNKENPLIQNAVFDQEVAGLIPRSFVILSILYGSYSGEPNRLSMLKDFIDLLERDFDEEELVACSYAKNKTDVFFPELHLVWENIRKVYGSPDFNLEVLPQTPYHAYSLFVLNCPNEISGKTGLIRLSNEICHLHSLMKEMRRLVRAQH